MAIFPSCLIFINNKVFGSFLTTCLSPSYILFNLCFQIDQQRLSSDKQTFESYFLSFLLVSLIPYLSLLFLYCTQNWCPDQKKILVSSFPMNLSVSFSLTLPSTLTVSLNKRTGRFSSLLQVCVARIIILLQESCFVLRTSLILSPKLESSSLFFTKSHDFLLFSP